MIISSLRLQYNGKKYTSVAETKRDAKEKCSEKCIPVILKKKVQEQKEKPIPKPQPGRRLSIEQMEDEVIIITMKKR